MKLKRFKEINHITDMREFFQNNMILGRGPVAFCSCPKCDDLLNDSSDINTHICTPEEEYKKVEHTWYKCTCGEAGCMFCDGGLGACTVCNGFEGTLTEECCGFRLDEYVLEAVYKGGLDYARGQWTVTPKEKKK